jgi:hypothetical protein
VTRRVAWWGVTSARGPKSPDAGSLLAIFAVTIYLMTAGGHAYSTDGTFAFEMAKSAVLDPDHQYWGRFRSAFARWGVAMPAFAQPFVLGGAAIGFFAPERDNLVVDGHRFRVETWPEVHADKTAAFPVPDTMAPSDLVRSVTIISYLTNAASVPDGTTVAEVQLTGPAGTALVPIRAGVETSEWAWDRPDVRGTLAHRRAEVAGHWVGQPRGNMYVARLSIDPPLTVSTWAARGTVALGERGTWAVRAASFEVVGAAPGTPQGTPRANDEPPPPDTGSRASLPVDPTTPVRQMAAYQSDRADSIWRDIRTGDRIWSERQSLDFWAQLGFGFANAFATAVSVLMVWRVAGHFGIREPARLLTAAGYAFGTVAWPYAKYDFSEPLASAAILVAADAMYRALPARPAHDVGDHRDPPLARSIAVVVVASLVAIAAKYAAALGVAALATEWLVGALPGVGDGANRRRTLTFGLAVTAPFFAVGAVAITVLLRTTGEAPILLTSGLDRLRDDWFTLPLWTGLRGLLFSSGKGLFVYAPWLLLAPVGMALFVVRARHRSLLGLVMVVGYPVLTTVAYAHKLVWHGGAWGPRYLVLALPWIALACAPAIEWALTRRTTRIALGALGAISVIVQLLAVSKHPEQFTAMARRHVLATMPRFGADLGGRDYWDARGGELLGRALRDEASGTARARSLGYLWGFPDASATIRFREAREVQIGLYAVDWDRRSRTETVTIVDSLGTRQIDLGPEMTSGVWIVTSVQGDPTQPVTIRLRQTGPDTAVLSAITFDPPSIPTVARDPRGLALDQETAGEWPGRYGRDGRIFLAFRSFNLDEARLPTYVEGYELDHVGDRPNPTIHVEIAEDDLLDTAILYAPPFSPLLGNAWLVAADLLHLLAPERPDLADGILIRPPWRWFGIDAPRLDHPEYGLGLDFWPTIIWTNYASHEGVVAGAAIALLTIELIGLCALVWLLRVAGTTPQVRFMSVMALAIAFAAFDYLMVLP